MEKIIVFTDGSSRGNPGPGGYGAIIVNKREDHVWEIGGRDEKTTNNRMELLAVIEALKRLKDTDQKIEIHTDSSYIINGVTKWVKGWQKNNWKTATKSPVLNQDLWQKLLDNSDKKDIVWKYAPGHSGVVGNERADTIATEFADNLKVKLYRGLVDDYGRDIFDLMPRSIKKKSTPAKKGQAYSYISEIDGVVVRHKTWSECEARVRGQKARFKKAMTLEDEKKIIEEFESR